MYFLFKENEYSNQNSSSLETTTQNESWLTQKLFDLKEHRTWNNRSQVASLTKDSKKLYSTSNTLQ